MKMRIQWNRIALVIALSSCLASSSAVAWAQNGSLFHGPRNNERLVYSQNNFKQVPTDSNFGNASPPNGGSLPTNVSSPPTANLNNANQTINPQAVMQHNQAMLGNAAMLPNGAPEPTIQSTFTYIPPATTRVLKKHDLVSIRVEESGQMLAAGNATSRKTTSYDTVLQDWIRLVGLDTVKPAPQSNGDPRTRLNEAEVYRGDSTMRTSESLTFNISAEITDILPNGNLVLTATKDITFNDNTFKASLSGICRPQDIDQSNVILSRNINGLKIVKLDDGHVRDGYSRGWVTRLFAKFKPF